jgi:hypothetical protein
MLPKAIETGVLVGLVRGLAFITFPVRLLLAPIFDSWNRQLALRYQAEFEEEIRKEVHFLFSGHHAVVVPNEGVPFPPSFDGAYVTLAVDKFFLRFERGRGDLTAGIASQAMPRTWYDLEVVLGAIRAPEDARRERLPFLSDVDVALRKDWEPLSEVFSRPSLPPEIESAVREITLREGVHCRAASIELNRRLYGK